MVSAAVAWLLLAVLARLVSSRDIHHACTIDTFDSIPTLNVFHGQYAHRRPFVIRGGAKEWPAMEWSFRSLLNAHGEVPLQTGSRDALLKRGGVIHSDDNEGARPHLRDYMAGLDLSSGVDAIENCFGVDGQGGYAFDQDDFLEDTLSLRNDLGFDVLLDGLGLSGMHPTYYLGLGSKCSGLSWHKHNTAFNAQILGHKLWFVAEQLPSDMWHVSLLDWFLNVRSQLDCQEQECPSTCVLGPGDVIYVPNGQYHTTANLDASLAVAIQMSSARGPITHQWWRAQKKNLQGRHAESLAEFEAVEKMCGAHAPGYVDLGDTKPAGLVLARSKGMQVEQLLMLNRCHEALALHEECEKYYPGLITNMPSSGWVVPKLASCNAARSEGTIAGAKTVVGTSGETGEAHP